MMMIIERTNVYPSWRGCGPPQSVIEHWGTSESSWPFGRKTVPVKYWLQWNQARSSNPSWRCCDWRVAHACSYPLVVMQQRPEGRSSHAAHFCLLTAQAANQHLHGFLWKTHTKLDVWRKRPKNKNLQTVPCATRNHNEHCWQFTGDWHLSALRNTDVQLAYKRCGLLKGNRNYLAALQPKMSLAPKADRYVHTVTSHPAVGRPEQKYEGGKYIFREMSNIK